MHMISFQIVFVWAFKCRLLKNQYVIAIYLIR